MLAGSRMETTIWCIAAWGSMHKGQEEGRGQVSGYQILVAKSMLRRCRLEASLRQWCGTATIGVVYGEDSNKV